MSSREKAKTVVMPVDFFDHVYMKQQNLQEIYSVQDITTLIKAVKWRSMADVCLWRLSACGAMTYRSNVEKRKVWDMRAPARRMKDVLEKYDPLEQAVSAARREGIPLYPWITLFDEGLPPELSRILEKHPEYQWVDRSGSVYLRGVPCYDYEEVMDFRLSHVSEILSYGVDGLYLSMRSHSNQSCPYRQKDFFGFNEPVAAEYKKRYGIDLRHFSDCTLHRDDRGFINSYEYKGGEFEVEAWHRLKGESLTRLLREIRKMAGQHLPLWMCFIGPFEDMSVPESAGIYTAPRYEGVNEMARMHLDWRTWLREGLIDTIVVQGHQGMEPEFCVVPFADDVHQSGGKLVWFAPVKKGPLCWEDTAKFVERIKDLPIDGVMPYEAVFFDESVR